MVNEEICGLTFDWDDVGIDDDRVVTALDALVGEYGSDTVWWRVSSSGEGLHVMIAEAVLLPSMEVMLQPIGMDWENQSDARKRFGEPPYELECRGRFISDSVRHKAGFRTSRIFGVKDGRKSGEWNKWGE